MDEPRRSGGVSSDSSVTETTIATPIASPRPYAPASIAQVGGSRSTKTRLGRAVSNCAAMSSRLERNLVRSHGVASSPVTAPTNSAAVAAPAMPCGPRRSAITGTTGSRIWNEIDMHTARPARRNGGPVIAARAFDRRGLEIKESYWPRWTNLAPPMPRREGPFLQLDYLYTPSDDVAADVRYFTEVLV